VLSSGELTVGAHSVSVIELNVQSTNPPSNNTGGNATVLGCTDSAAENYDPTATQDDNSCTYPSVPVPGCTDEAATNYNAEATQDDGNCQYETDPVDPCSDVFCDACPDGWDTVPAEEGACCPSCLEPSENNQTNATNQTNGTANETINETGLQTCELCCGETYQHPADQACPVMSCLPCEDEEASTTSSSADTVRNGLIGVVLLLVLVLTFTGRRPPKDGFEASVENDDSQANLS
jgi:hypothetical protein